MVFRRIRLLFTRNLANKRYMLKIKLFYFVTVAVLLTGCTTTASFKVPKGSDLFIYRRPIPVVITVDEPSSTAEVTVGTVTSKPFFWTAAGRPPGGGIPYKIEKNGELLKEGRLCSKFRVIAIFWPPLAMIYWPLGYHPDITYDLTSDVQECY